MPPFLTDDSKRALTASIRAVESQSSAEVVIAVKPQSAHYVHADFIVGAAATFATLAYLLFSAQAFAPISILIDPFVAGALVGFLASRSPELRRALTPSATRQRWVGRAARAAFYEKGIRRTSARTGILVYISLLERRAEVVADSGVTDAVPAAAWARATGAIRDAVARGAAAAEVARAIEALAEPLAPALPHSDDDVNELPDEVAG